MEPHELKEWLSSELTQKALKYIDNYRKSIQDDWLKKRYIGEENNAHAMGMAQICWQIANDTESFFNLGGEDE